MKENRVTPSRRVSSSAPPAPAAPSSSTAILDAATALLDQAGPEAVTARAVAERVGLSHNAPFKHFRDKEALLAAVAARELAAMGTLAEAASADDAGADAALRQLTRNYVRWAMQFPHRFRLVFGRWTRDDVTLSEAATRTRTRFVESVRTAQRQGTLPAGNPERLASLLLALTHGATDLALGGHLARDGKGAADPEDLVDDLFTLLAAGAGRRRAKRDETK